MDILNKLGRDFPCEYFMSCLFAKNLHNSTKTLSIPSSRLYTNALPPSPTSRILGQIIEMESSVEQAAKTLATTMDVLEISLNGSGGTEVRQHLLPAQ